MMLKRSFFLLFVFLITTQLQSQNYVLIDIDTIKDGSKYRGHIAHALIENGDTLIHIPLRSITILPPFKFKSNRQKRRYSRLVRYVKKVYPYSQIVSNQLYDIHNTLDKLPNKKYRNLYIKQKERELKKQFEGQLRKLTYTQGRILIKLINRETGFTTYEIVKELKGSINAFFWQSIARIFGSNLKMEYDARGDDRMIEDIVVRIENGML